MVGGGDVVALALPVCEVTQLFIFFLSHLLKNKASGGLERAGGETV